MHILHVLFNPGLGGVEQAFLDYSNVLLEYGHTITAMVSPGAKILPALSKLPIRIYQEQKIRRNLRAFDVFAIRRLRKFVRELQPDIILVHNARPIGMLREVARGICPLVAVNHGSEPKRTIRLDGVLVVNEMVRQQVIAAGQPEADVYVMPNMIDVPAGVAPPVANHPIPVIGNLARFAPDKSQEILVQALAILKSRNIPFRAILAGDGNTREKIMQLAKNLGLEEAVSFPGWIYDKKAFYKELDIYCLSSRYESFGIVLLEALLYGIPVVTTDADGPKEIIEDGKTGYIVPRDNPQAMAEALITLLNNIPKRQEFVQAGYQSLMERYGIKQGGERLERFLIEIIEKYKVMA